MEQGDQPSPARSPSSSSARGAAPRVGRSLPGAPRPSWNPPSPAPQDSGPAEPARGDRSRLASGRPPPAPLPQDGPRPTGKKPAKPLRTPGAFARAHRGGPVPPAPSYLPAAPELGPGGEGRTGSERLRVTPDNGERPQHGNCRPRAEESRKQPKRSAGTPERDGKCRARSAAVPSRRVRAGTERPALSARSQRRPRSGPGRLRPPNEGGLEAPLPPAGPYPPEACYRRRAAPSPGCAAGPAPPPTPCPSAGKPANSCGHGPTSPLDTHPRGSGW
ncbi:PREDICTED: basic proline-rich protein-like [Haliaeetus leucocephalus]|uniref:basic proline-rich protein-like n=1 Tax=Haliaeetus leucocephalus TaxID=52644 RepID=UPI00053CE2F4|nr:PREDICTED: basic proline-rich protein-like [Haliaeetus leucocephalus]